MALLAALLGSSYLHLNGLFRFAAKDLAYALVFLWLVDRAAEGFGGAAGRLLGARPVVYLGGISYGLYLYHEFVPALVRLLERGLGVRLYFPAEMGVPRLLAVTAATVPLAALSWHLFEKPINGLKSRFPYVEKDEPPAAEGPQPGVPAAVRGGEGKGPRRRRRAAEALLDTNRRGP
jgi:peptidoglycan/LPS O-acetylase OafA/YrhL